MVNEKNPHISETKKADWALIQEPLDNDEEAEKCKRYCGAQEFYSFLEEKRSEYFDKENTGCHVDMAHTRKADGL